MGKFDSKTRLTVGGQGTPGQWNTCSPEFCFIWNTRSLRAGVPFGGLATMHALSRKSFIYMCGAGAAGLVLAGCGSTQGSSSSSSGGASSQSEDSSAETSTTDPQSVTLFVFDTVVQISALCSKELMDQISDRCTYFENKFSRTVEGSDIWNINNAHGASVEVADETAEVISDALEYSKASDGLFDITIGAVSSLWDFDEGVKPDDAAIQAALPHVGYDCVQVDGNTVTLSDPEAMLDLGGIAKGFIADDLVRMFQEGGCEDASISLGGNVYVMGKSFDGDAWNVGVQDPNGNTNDVVATIEAADESLVTSGLYERSFTQDGVLYYHILDPKTGYPVKTDLESSTVESQKSVDGDAYSTILFLLGHDKALELLNSDERFEGLLVNDEGEISTSDGSRFVVLS